MKKKVIVLGSNGMAGHVLTLSLRAFPNEFEVLDVSRTPSAINPARLFEVSNFKKLESVINEFNPDVIVNCVGLLSQSCEDNPDLAVLMNGYLPHHLERITKDTNCKVISVSTDCVFSGSRGGYKEVDLKDGIGFYAMSKSIGEINNSKDLTFRTSIIGPELKIDGIGLFNWFMNQTGEIKGYRKAYWTGVTTIELAKAIREAIKQNLTGVYQLVNNEKINKHDLLTLAKDIFKREDVSLNPYDGYVVDKSLINTRTDFNYIVPSYNDMLIEMEQWVKKYRDYYTNC